MIDPRTDPAFLEWLQHHSDLWPEMDRLEAYREYVAIMESDAQEQERAQLWEEALAEDEEQFLQRNPECRPPECHANPYDEREGSEGTGDEPFHD